MQDPSIRPKQSANDLPLTDEQRFPLMTASGRELMTWMMEHPSAPRFNHRCGDRLTREGLQRVREFDHLLRTAERGWRPGEIPSWVSEYATWCLSDVPIYRRRGGSASAFLSLPPCTREDIGREPWSFVPESAALDDLIVYETSGTTGHPIYILSHPDVSSMYLPALRAALGLHGITLEGGPDRISIVLICAQNFTYTYASVSSYLDDAGFLKLNLNPHDWRNPEDRTRFLDDCRPEIYTGDPVSFLELAKLPLSHRPRALVSTSMSLLPGMATELERHFGCPVIDLYSMNESRLIAVRTRRGYEVVPHDLFIEILDPDGRPAAAGERGEIVITGGRNRFLPLLRYRTGDHARLEFYETTPVLVDLDGRPPTLFLKFDGSVVNNIDISYILKPFPIAQFTLHQHADRSLSMKLRGSGIDMGKLEMVLRKLFGPEQAIEFHVLTDADTGHGKLHQYTSDITEISLRDSPISFLPISWQDVLNP